MSKTILQDGSPVSPQLINALNNPVYKETPSEDGEISYPPQAGNPNRVEPVNMYLNPSLGIKDNSGLSNADLSSGVAALPTNKTRSNGLLLSTETTFSGSLGLAEGDPTKGFWFFNTVGTFQTGDIVQFAIDSSITSLGNVLSSENFGIEQSSYYLTEQFSVKNESGSTAQIEASISDSILDGLIVSGKSVLVKKSEPIALNPGQSAVLKVVYKVIPDGNYLGTPVSSMNLKFRALSSGSATVDVKNIGQFLGNFKDENLFIPSNDSISQLVADLNEGKYFESGSYIATGSSIQFAQGGETKIRTTIFVPFSYQKLQINGDLTISNLELIGVDKIDGSITVWTSGATATVVKIEKNGFALQIETADLGSFPTNLHELNVDFDYSYISY